MVGRIPAQADIRQLEQGEIEVRASERQMGRPVASAGDRVSISPNVSVALDIVRFLLALTVAFGHSTEGYFQSEWPDMTGLGVLSVGGFFILSGYTIRSFSSSGDAFDMRRFIVDRSS